MKRNRLEEFTAAARAARTDAPPPLDVSRAVLLRLEAADDAIDRPLAWLTAAGLTAAAASAAVTTTLYGAWADPLGALFHITPVLGL